MEMSQPSAYRIYLQHKKTECKFYIGDPTCACGKAEETAAHMLQCSQLAHSCSLDDLIMFNDVGKQCAEVGKRMA